MAFKINTQAYQVRYPQATPSTPSKPNVNTPIKNTIKTGSPTTTPQLKYPSHNLLSKYNSAGSYYNSQNILNHQLGIKNNPTSYNEDEGKKALIENLQQQNNTFNYGISNSGSSNLGWSDALNQYLELEDKALQQKLQEQQAGQVQSDFLNELLWNLKKNLSL
ncbi:hypothetical protein [uncultured Helicobacter sp.]|uniref:hypothetical protein n=1 Tax=uncultured Helicobacter sp. TaxID=175537 RepID=UPI0026273C05|nr:hypothetical protein [uncultured Helicobacter sp.]